MMEANSWNDWKGKQVYVILKNKRRYTGLITDISNIGDGSVFIKLLDKFDKNVGFLSSEIEVIQEEEVM